MGTGLIVAAALAAVTAVVVVRFLPGREPVAADVYATRPGTQPLADTDQAAEARG